MYYLVLDAKILLIIMNNVDFFFRKSLDTKKQKNKNKKQKLIKLAYLLIWQIDNGK